MIKRHAARSARWRLPVSGIAAGLVCSGLVAGCAQDAVGPPADVTPPTIALGFAACCQFPRGSTVTLVADASDDVGVSRVEFAVRLPGATAFQAFHTDPTPPFEAVYPAGGFGGADNGTHAFLAYAFDAAGNQGTSNPAEITIAIDVTAPQVSVVPRATRLTTPGAVVIEVVTDEVGRVVLYDDGVKVDSITAPVIPYIFRRTYGPADNGTHTLTATVTDGDGNVGTSQPVSFPVDIRWAWLTAPPATLLEAVAVNGAGAAYVAGSAPGGTGADGFVAALSGSGDILWQRTYGDATNEQTGHSVAVDPATGAVFLAGDTYVYGTRPEAQCFLVKYDAAGTLQWSREVGDTLTEAGGFVAVDAFGHSYLAGSTWGSIDGNPNQGRLDAFLVKFDGDGTLVWSRQLGSTGGPFNDDRVSAIAVEPASAVYIAGTTDGNMEPGYTGDGYLDAWVAKYDLDGNLQWRRQLGVHGPDDYIQGVAVGPSGDVYVAGWNRGGLDGGPIGGLTDIFVAKYTADGTREWVRQLGSTALYVGSPWDYATAVSADASGVYLTGMTSANLDGNTYQGFDDLFLAKYTADGTLAWVRTLGTPAGDQGWGVATDGVSGVFVVGAVAGTAVVAKHPLP